MEVRLTKINCENIVIFITCLRMRIYMPIWISWWPLLRQSISTILKSNESAFVCNPPADYFAGILSKMWSKRKHLWYSPIWNSIKLISMYCVLFTRLRLNDSTLYLSIAWNDRFLICLPADSIASSMSTLSLLNRNCSSMGILLQTTTGLNISQLNIVAPTFSSVLVVVAMMRLDVIYFSSA